MAGSSRPRDRRREPGRGAAVLAGALGAALVVAVVLAGYLWVSAEAWRDRAEQDDAERARLTTTAAALQQRVSALQADLDASDARVEALAAEKARAADLREAAAQRSGSSSASASARGAAALGGAESCAASLRSLLGVVLPAGEPDPAAAHRLAVSADEDCAGVQPVQDVQGTSGGLADAVAGRS